MARFVWICSEVMVQHLPIPLTWSPHSPNDRESGCNVDAQVYTPPFRDQE